MQPSIHSSARTADLVTITSTPRVLRLFRWTRAAAALGAIAVVLASDGWPQVSPTASTEAGLRAELHDHTGQAASICAWAARDPRHVTRMEAITHPRVREIIEYLRRSPRFQKVLAHLERDRRQRYSWERWGVHSPDPTGALVRETALVAWIPRDRSELQLYTQTAGGVFAYSNFADGEDGAVLSTPCEVALAEEADYHLRFHTHPWGTVPSNHDLQNALEGVIDFVVSAKNGEPTIYMFSAIGPAWEFPTKLFCPDRLAARAPAFAQVQR